MHREPLDRRLPDFVIIGTMKSGTTTLYRWLQEHPDVSLPKVKEPNFFSDDRVWQRGLDWYSGLFAGSDPHQRSGEASVSYTDPRWARRAAERLRVTAGRARLVCVLRDPVERLRSHYRHELQRGRERRPLVQALDRPGNPYMARSRYAAALKPWVELFPREQLCVVRLEDLIGDDGQTWRRVLGHVRVGSRDRPVDAHNVTADKFQFTAPMRILWNSGLARRADGAPAPVRRVARGLLLRGGNRYQKRLAGSQVPIPNDLLAPVLEDVARLPALLGDERLAW